MLVVIHKECGGPALEESPIGEVCAIPVDRFPFSCFTCLEEEEIEDESEVGYQKNWRLRQSIFSGKNSRYTSLQKQKDLSSLAQMILY
jgi:glycosylphosphatidylinositol transamidase (GPIT) subunit GPI8